MQDQLVKPRTAAYLLGGALITIFVPISGANAFPFIDTTNPGGIATGAPLGTDLPDTDAKGLRNQLRLTNPGAGIKPGSWTIVPRFVIQEYITDNAFEVSSPRRPDAITLISPGISIGANTARLQMKFDYQPNLALHAVNGSLNSLTQQMNLGSTLTVVPDLVFIDVRGVSGVQSALGALNGGGTLGAGATAGAGTAGGLGGGAGGQGVNRRNLVQTTSFGVSPYMSAKFGDFGSAKAGVSGDMSRTSTLSGFAASPFPTGGGTGSQTLVTTEEMASFTTGERFGKLQNTLSFNMSQSRTQTNGFNNGTGATNTTPTSFTSERRTLNNQLSYALNRTFTLLGSIGQQSISYSQANAPKVNGLTWNAGLTITPGPDSSMTVTYGHQNGADAFSANGHIALTARTLLSFDYSNTVGTQLENLQAQLNNAALTVNGQAVNAQTGGPQFGSANALGVQNGVFRYDTLNISLASEWQRDKVQASFIWSIQTAVNSNGTTNNSNANDVKTATLGWTRELRPDMNLSASASYSLIRRTGGLGVDTALSTAVSLQYILSETASVTGRYSFFDRSSRTQGASFFENILVLGLSKQF